MFFKPKREQKKFSVEFGPCCLGRLPPAAPPGLRLLAGRGPAALGALVLVADHLAHLDEAAVQARQLVVQGAVLQVGRDIVQSLSDIATITL